MNCTEMRERLGGLPGQAPETEYSPSEREHLEHCDGCRDIARREQLLRRRIAEAGRLPEPDDAYWRGVLPRVMTDLTDRTLSDWVTGRVRSADIAVPVVGMAVVALFLMLVNVTDPPVPAPEQVIATLSGPELLELHSSEKYTGLLDVTGESMTTTYAPVTDFLAELFTQGGGELYASVDPVELLRDVDDTRFAEIVNILNSQ